MEKPKTIGVFAGIINKEGKLLLQQRIEKRSIIPGKSYKGDWELPGGKVKEGSLRHALTLEVLTKELIREVKEELGLKLDAIEPPYIYLTVFVNEEKGINDWAFMFPVFIDRTSVKLKRKVVWVDPSELRELANRPKEEGQLLSGWGKRMSRMSLAAFLVSPINRTIAQEMLNEVRPDWRESELLSNPRQDLFQIRYELGFEEDLLYQR